MENIAGILWTILGVALIVAEVFTFGFVLFWFGVGALVAALAAYIGFGTGIQFLGFAATSIVLTILSRKIFAKFYSHGGGISLKTGVDSLPGQIGTVTGASSGALNAGEVKVYGSTWKAFPVDSGLKLIEGEKVEVVSINGTTIYVRRYEELPEWRGDS